MIMVMKSNAAISSVNPVIVIVCLPIQIKCFKIKFSIVVCTAVIVQNMHPEYSH